MSRFRAPRRLRFHRAGWTVSVGAIGLGLAAMATGNNLLYLLLGAMLGLIALSGWLSELTLRGVEIERRVPHGIEAGSRAHLAYHIRNAKRLLPSFALEIGERREEERGFLPSLARGARATVRVEHVRERRGVHPLDTVTIATSFPFGFFRKERDLERPAEVVVWPRTTRAVREARPAGDRSHRSGELAAGASAARGEYRSLRGYLPGDDPRDVHWRSSARTGEPVVREYAREQAQTLWVCLDLRGVDTEAVAGVVSAGNPSRGARPDDDGPRSARRPWRRLWHGGGWRGTVPVAQDEAVDREAADARQEIAVEIAAALAARAAHRGQPFALVTPDARVEQGTGARQLERVLDALARARFRPDAPAPVPPASRDGSVLVTPAATAIPGVWGDVLTPDEGR